MLARTKNGFLSPFANSSKHKMKYSFEEVKSMRERKLKGESYRSIGKDFGVSGATIYNTVLRHYPIIKKESLPNGYIHILTYCEDNGFTYYNLIHHIRKKRIKTVKYQNKLHIHKDTIIENAKFIKDEVIEKILELKKQGFNKTQISKELNLNRKTVRVYWEMG